MWEKQSDGGWATWALEGLVGIGYKVCGACKMRLANAINGSGSRAFGGAKTWPKIDLEIDFQTGEETYRDALAERLRKTTEQFFAEMKEQGVRK